MNLVQESVIIFRRQLRMNLRNPTWIIIGIMQPVLYLTLFGPLLKPLVAEFGATNAYTFFVPGLLVQLGIFGSLFAGFGLIAEWREGVIEAERVTPARRSALLIGRLVRDVLGVFIQATILVALGWAAGMTAPLTGVLAGLGLTLLLATAFAAISNAVALTVKSEDVLAPLLNMTALPILLLSGILLPLTLGPQWLQSVGHFLPFRWIVDAIRDAFVGNFATQNMLVGAVWAVTICALTSWWGVRVFHRENT